MGADTRHLAGHKISAIENLGVTEDQLDSIDFTDNSIASLSNFPLLRRLTHLFLSNNPVRTISPSVPASLPNLKTLILTGCEFPKEALGGLGVALGSFKKLEMLSLKACPVAEAEYYREWIIYKCRRARFLDFEKVKDQERQKAKTLFETADGKATPLATQLMAAAPATNGVTKTFEPGAPAGKAGRLLSKEEKDKIRAAIEGATSVDEVRLVVALCLLIHTDGIVDRSAD